MEQVIKVSSRTIRRVKAKLRKKPLSLAADRINPAELRALQELYAQGKVKYRNTVFS